jgi:hypothetical protein
MTTKQIIEQFGEKSLPDGPNLSELMATLSTESRSNDMDKLRLAVTEWEADAARMEDDRCHADRELLGAERHPTDLSTVGIDATVSIPTTTRVGVMLAGFRTVGDLAGATTANVRGRLSEQGITVDDAPPPASSPRLRSSS